MRASPASPEAQPAAVLAELGGFIRDQRRMARLSLRKLSELAGISNPYLSQIERGLRKPSAEILQAIARALRISAETLYVRAGILEAREGDSDLVTEVFRDTTITERQKQVLIEIYRSFQRSFRRPGSLTPRMPSMPVRSVAVVSLHTSPVAQPGVGDGGGMNIYVRSLSSALARAGVACDVYTRAEHPGQPRGGHGRAQLPGDPRAGRPGGAGPQGEPPRTGRRVHRGDAGPDPRLRPGLRGAPRQLLAVGPGGAPPEARAVAPDGGDLPHPGAGERQWRPRWRRGARPGSGRDRHHPLRRPHPGLHPRRGRLPRLPLRRRSRTGSRCCPPASTTASSPRATGRRPEPGSAIPAGGCCCSSGGSSR